MAQASLSPFRTRTTALALIYIYFKRNRGIKDFFSVHLECSACLLSSVWTIKMVCIFGKLAFVCSLQRYICIHIHTQTEGWTRLGELG